MSIEHNYPFDPANGMSESDLLTVRGSSGPEGFKEFWQENYRLTMTAELKYRIESELWSPVPEDRIYRIRVTN